MFDSVCREISETSEEASTKLQEWRAILEGKELRISRKNILFEMQF